MIKVNLVLGEKNVHTGEVAIKNKTVDKIVNEIVLSEQVS